MSEYNILIGKDDSLDTSAVGMTHAVVVKLLEGLEGRGHHVYTDNFYSSSALFGDLRRLGFGACGMVQMNRRGVPTEMKAALKKGETISTQIDNIICCIMNNCVLRLNVYVLLCQDFCIAEMLIIDYYNYIVSCDLFFVL